MRVAIVDTEIASAAGMGVALHHSLLDAQSSPLSTQKEGVGSLPSDLEASIKHFASQSRLRDHDPIVKLGCFLGERIMKRQRPHNLESVGIMVGSSRGTQQTLERALLTPKDQRIATKSSPLTTGGILASEMSRFLGLYKSSQYVSTSCTTGLNAIGLAAILIEAKFTDGMLAGAVESCTKSLMPRMLSAVGVLQDNPSDPCLPTQPFGSSPQRPNGIILSDGAGLLLLSSIEQLTSDPIAYITGYGASIESGTLTGVSPDANALQKAIHQACAQANISLEDISFVVGHGSGTDVGDASEIACYRKVFGGCIPPIVGHKWLTGHALGASGAISLALGIGHLNSQILPRYPYPTVPETWQKGGDQVPFKHFLACALGFGGFASAIVVTHRNA